jgi:hypothetical protein
MQTITGVIIEATIYCNFITIPHLFLHSCVCCVVNHFKLGPDAAAAVSSVLVAGCRSAP